MIEDHAQSPGFQRVRRFMQKCGQRTPDVPFEPTQEDRKRMAAVLLEEIIETIEKGLGVNVVWKHDKESRRLSEPSFHIMGPFDMVEAVDGALDTIVTARAILIGCGVADWDLEEAIDTNNLAKFGPGSCTREDGKHMKPPNHPAPPIALLLKDQGWNG